MQTLIEFIAEKDEVDIEWVKNFINGLMKSVIENPVHYGDCTNDIHTCNLCCLEGILNEYYVYFKKQNYANI